MSGKNEFGSMNSPGGDVSCLGRDRDDSAGGVQRLRQIRQDVVDMLDPDRQPDIARGHARRFLLLRVNCECVVLAGWIARLRASPILATW